MASLPSGRQLPFRLLGDSSLRGSEYEAEKVAGGWGQREGSREEKGREKGRRE